MVSRSTFEATTLKKKHAINSVHWTFFVVLYLNLFCEVEMIHFPSFFYVATNKWIKISKKYVLKLLKACIRLLLENYKITIIELFKIFLFE